MNDLNDPVEKAVMNDPVEKYCLYMHSDRNPGGFWISATMQGNLRWAGPSMPGSHKPLWFGSPEEARAFQERMSVHSTATPMHENDLAVILLLTELS